MKRSKRKPTLYGGYELGRTYFISYWRQECTVTALHGAGGWNDWAVTVRWEDGTETTHSTVLDRRDRVITDGGVEHAAN